MGLITTIKVTAYPINPAYLPRVHIVRSTNHDKAKQMAKDLVKDIRAESWMTGEVKVEECGAKTIRGPVANFVKAQARQKQYLDELVMAILGPAFKVPAPFGEGTFHYRTSTNMDGEPAIHGEWYGPGYEDSGDMKLRWEFAIYINPNDWSDNRIELTWRANGVAANTTIDADDVKDTVTRMIAYAKEHPSNGGITHLPHDYEPKK